MAGQMRNLVIIGCVPWIILIVWLLKTQCDEAEGKNPQIQHTSDYFTGMGLRPEDIWGHGCFDDVLEEEYSSKRLKPYS